MSLIKRFVCRLFSHSFAHHLAGELCGYKHCARCGYIESMTEQDVIDFFD